MLLRAVLLQLSLLFVLLLPIQRSVSQIVNTEAKRFQNQEKGLSGEQSLTLMYRDWNGPLLSFGHEGRIGYGSKRNKLLLLTHYAILRTGDDGDRLSEGFAHLRNTYHTETIVAMEAFTQLQRSWRQSLAYRSLTGVGPRLTIYEGDSGRVSAHAGMAYMFEYEQIQDTSITNLAHRGSAYLNLALNVPEILTLSNTFYFQPNLQAFADYRLLNQSKLSFEITEHFTTDFFISVFYDTRPPLELPRTFWNFSSGVGLKW
ncbi:MAG: DUF481 domain-containing protein [Bacteroidota bacterium]